MALPNPFGILSSLSRENQQQDGAIQIGEKTVRFEYMTLAVPQIARVCLLKSAVNPLWPAAIAPVLLLLALVSGSGYIYGLFALVAGYAALCWWHSRKKYVTVSSSDGATFTIVTRSEKFQKDVYNVFMRKMNETSFNALIDMSTKTINVGGSVGGDVIMGDGNRTGPA